MTLIERLELKDPKTQKALGVFARGTGDFELRDYLRQLWRHRQVLFGTIVVLTITAAIVVFQMTPLYKGTVLVMIAPPKTQVVKIESVLPGLPFDSDTINSEIAIIRSRTLADRVVTKLKLDQDPEFNRALTERGGLFRKAYRWVRSIVRAPVPTDLTGSEGKAIEQAQVVATLLSVLSVEPVYQSRVVSINISSPDSKKAALIANTVAELYLLEQLEFKFEATQRATRWLSERIGTLRAAVERSEQAVEAYRRANGLIKGKDDITVAASQISELSSQLVASRAKRAETEARLAQIEKLLKSRRGGGIYSSPEVLSSTLIQRLRERESEVIGKMAELNAEFGPKHPKMIAVRAELEDLRSKIGAEVQKIVDGVRNDVLVAKAREESLERSLNLLESKASVLNEKSVRLRTLEREATANRTLLQTVLSRFKETSEQEGIQAPDARIISNAVPPAYPYHPNRALLMGLAFAGSVVIGLTLVVLVEHLDSGFRSSEQVETVTGLPALGLVPEINRRQHSGATLREYLADNPLSAYVESIRGLQVSLALSDVDQPLKTVLITSTAPQEGKSALAYSLAAVAARFGKKVVLVDCDLRRPTQHDIIEIAQKPGLVELLSRRTSFNKALQTDPKSGLKVITSGELPPNPPDLLASENMRRLIEKLNQEFDLVVIDSPPAMAVSDARILGRSVDRVLYVVRWARTRRDKVMFAVKQLADSGSRVAGIAINRVDVRKHARYGFADSGYYHGEYTKYYSS